MTRPEIIRADTIDLQDHKAPSAKDHSRQPSHPAAIGAGPAAPHQAEAQREYAAEQAQYQNGAWEDNNQPGNDQYDIAEHAASDATVNGNNYGQQRRVLASQNGDINVDQDGDADDDSMDDDDMMDKISSSPSIDDEDIDFEFVYALHTFVATVEGQANATKGDTMVLLDDSNSYWWLVRVVKDSSIGYLPAEHIETPTERLARLNKHRNVDLSASQLPDLEEKKEGKNPIVNAIKKRKAKNVTFNSVHNYVEASDVEYSSDEDEDNSFAYQQDHDESSEVNEDEITSAEPERAGVREVLEGEDGEEIVRASSDSFDGPSRSRNGTVRNTDSFFKDDTVETRKITITPNLLRDDSNTAQRPSVDVTPVQGRASLDKLQKDAPAAEKVKDKKAGKDKKEKVEKEKKPGMLSGLFKRKDKKRNLEDEDPDELIMGRKASKDSERTASPEKMSLEMTNSNEDVVGSERSGSSPQRQPSKLQKARSGDNVGKLQSLDEVKPLETHGGEGSIRTVDSDSGVAPLSLRSRGDSVTSNPGRTSNDSVDSRSTAQSLASKILHKSRSNSEAKNNEPKLEKTKAAKQRVSMDADSDSEVEEINHDRFLAPAQKQQHQQQQQAPAPQQQQQQYIPFSPTRATALPAPAPRTERVLSPVNKLLHRPVPGAFPDSYASTQASTDTTKRIESGEPAYQDDELERQDSKDRNAYDERLSESPIEIYGNEQQEQQGHERVREQDESRNPFANPPDLTSSHDDRYSPPSSPSPELIEVTDTDGRTSAAPLDTSVGGLHEPKDTWNDASLREFFDDGEEVRDLLVVVYDKTGVEPVGNDHPVVGGMFSKENLKLADMTNRLDNMLGDWLARKRSSGGP